MAVSFPGQAAKSRARHLKNAKYACEVEEELLRRWGHCVDAPSVGLWAGLRAERP